MVGAGGFAHEFERRPGRTGGVGDAERADGADEARIAQGGVPGDGCAPVVADDDGRAGTGPADEGGDIGGEAFEGVRLDRSRGAAGAVAALVGHDDAVAGGSERADLVAPGVRQLGEAVEEDDRRPGAGLEELEVDAGRDGHEAACGARDHAVAMTSGSKVVAIWPAAASRSISSSERPRTSR
jgi:hypothetical protein